MVWLGGTPLPPPRPEERQDTAPAAISNSMRGDADISLGKDVLADTQPKVAQRRPRQAINGGLTRSRTVRLASTTVGYSTSVAPSVSSFVRVLGGVGASQIAPCPVRHNGDCSFDRIGREQCDRSPSRSLLRVRADQQLHAPLFRLVRSLQQMRLLRPVLQQVLRLCGAGPRRTRLPRPEPTWRVSPGAQPPDARLGAFGPPADRQSGLLPGRRHIGISLRPAPGRSWRGRSPGS